MEREDQESPRMNDNLYYEVYGKLDEFSTCSLESMSSDDWFLESRSFLSDCFADWVHLTDTDESSALFWPTSQKETITWCHEFPLQKTSHGPGVFASSDGVLLQNISMLPFVLQEDIVSMALGPSKLELIPGGPDWSVLSQDGSFHDYLRDRLNDWYWEPKRFPKGSDPQINNSDKIYDAMVRL